MKLSRIRLFLWSLHVEDRLFVVLLVIAAMFLASHAFGSTSFFWLALVCATLFALCLVVELSLLYNRRADLEVSRRVDSRFSNGDFNPVAVSVASTYPWDVSVLIIDELPVQLEVRDFEVRSTIRVGQVLNVDYDVRPTERGVYLFGAVNVYVIGALGILSRRFSSNLGQSVAVYPAYFSLLRSDFLPVALRQSEYGRKRVRARGNTMEFDQVRDYVAGDDYRLMNWKASARAARPMVNQYCDEKSQQVYCIIDKGRSMQMPFKEMTLLDHSINAALVLLDIALKKEDRAGLLTFSQLPGKFVPAARNGRQTNRILEALYSETTQWLEPNFEALYATIRAQIPQRSLLLLFTNFESTSALARVEEHLSRMARQHLLVVVLFENDEVQKRATGPARDVVSIYSRGLAEATLLEKREIVRRLARVGAHPILCSPSELTVAVINKYLALKAERRI